MEWYRFQYWSPKGQLKEFLRPSYDWGCDQWGNPSIILYSPLGALVIFYGRFKRDKWYCLGHSEGEVQFFSPDEELTAFVPMEKVWRYQERISDGKAIVMTEAQIRYRATRILTSEAWQAEVDEYVKKKRNAQTDH